MRIYPRNTLITRHNRNGHNYTVVKNWIVTISKLGTDVIAAHFKTDYASIPQALWWLYSPVYYRDEGTLHDWLYEKQEWSNRKLTRKQADKILRDFVKQRHGKTTAFNFYWAVRLSIKAKKTWNKYKNKGGKNEN